MARLLLKMIPMRTLAKKYEDLEKELEGTKTDIAIERKGDKVYAVMGKDSREGQLTENLNGISLANLAAKPNGTKGISLHNLAKDEELDEIASEKKEAEEHPSFSKKQIHKIVEDHEKAEALG